MALLLETAVLAGLLLVRDGLFVGNSCSEDTSFSGRSSEVAFGSSEDIERALAFPVTGDRAMRALVLNGFSLSSFMTLLFMFTS